MRHKVVAAVFRRRIIGAALVASLLATIYWLAIASDRYVSEAHVIVQRTDLAGGRGMDFQSLLTGGTGNRPDQLLLRDHLRSVDMLRKLDAALNLRKHYSDPEHDILSRMWDDNTSIERFHAYFLSRTEIEFDDYGGLIMIKAQAYDPRTAHAITAMLVQEGERFMNRMAHDLAQAQVSFPEQQVSTMNQRALMARRAVLEYQDRKGLVSPQASAETVAGIVARLEVQRTELQTQRSSLLTYLVPDHPNVVMLNQQLAAVERQIAQEQARLTSPGGRTLNRTVEEFQRLEMDAAFAQDVYKTALVALERGRVEATRTIKKVSQLQAPTLPEYPMEPRRAYNALVFFLIAMLLATIAQMLVTIVRDHQD
ncbi:chain-length determining protein [Ramlibacter terrae]|uniref:Chain-length determining protein n=1 Tax=Ramlibacter terrae TaxID=2732511 RepID=A0ABX6P6I9_9BURK|nr:chain-length determining protein [Ramlibacter terrae]